MLSGGVVERRDDDNLIALCADLGSDALYRTLGDGPLDPAHVRCEKTAVSDVVEAVHHAADGSPGEARRADRRRVRQRPALEQRAQVQLLQTVAQLVQVATAASSAWRIPRPNSSSRMVAAR